jgi:uncharacterized membrane protein
VKSASDRKSCLTNDSFRAFLILFQLTGKFSTQLRNRFAHPGQGFAPDAHPGLSVCTRSVHQNLDFKGTNMPDETVGTAQTGLSDSAASGLAYITFIPAIIFLVVPPYNQSANVRFHCWQSIGLAICGFALGIIGIIPILGWLILLVGMLGLFVVWIMCVIKAFGGGRFVIPVIGQFAAKQAGAVL